MMVMVNVQKSKRRAVLLFGLMLLLQATTCRSHKLRGRVRELAKNKDTEAPTPFPTAFPTPEPTEKPKSNKNRKTDDPTPSPSTSPTTAEPSPSPTPLPSAGPTPSPTALPTDDPSASPSDEPTTSKPTGSPTDVPTETIVTETDAPAAAVMETDAPVASPTAGPTESPSSAPSTSEPSAGPTALPTEPPTELPTGLPTESPTDKPILFIKPADEEAVDPKDPAIEPSPTGAPVSTTATETNTTLTVEENRLALLGFNVLLTSTKGAVNVGQLETTLEGYILEGMPYDELKSVDLTIVEGDSLVRSDGVTSTTARFSALATFKGDLPPLSDIRAEQGYLLKAKGDVQKAVDANPVLQGARVVKVDFNRIDVDDAASTKSRSDDGPSTTSIVIGVIVGLAACLTAGALLILRNNRVYKEKVKAAVKDLDERKAKATKVQNNKFDHNTSSTNNNNGGCASLISVPMSLGVDGDASAPQTPRPAEEISITQASDMDDDDEYGYLTMDEGLDGGMSIVDGMSHITSSS